MTTTQTRLTRKRILVNKIVLYLHQRGVERPTAFRWSFISHEATGIGKEGLIATPFEHAFPAIREQMRHDGGFAVVKITDAALRRDLLDSGSARVAIRALPVNDDYSPELYANMIPKSGRREHGAVGFAVIPPGFHHPLLEVKTSSDLTKSVKCVRTQHAAAKFHAAHGQLDDAATRKLLQPLGDDVVVAHHEVPRLE